MMSSSKGMSNGKAFLYLIRFPNLVYILLAEWLTQYGIIKPFAADVSGQRLLGTTDFALLTLSIAFLAAAGYIINDYFDINIDLVNKPDRVIIDKFISRRWAIAFHTLFNVIGVGIGGYLALKIGHPYLVLYQVGISLLLWGYSTNYKRKVLSGNAIISVLTACSILTPALFQPSIWPLLSNKHLNLPLGLFQLLTAYIVFAFLISMIREIIKDLEDVPGDEKEGCRTLPIVYGLNAARDWVIVLGSLLLSLVAVFQTLFIIQGFWVLPLYLLICLDLPLAILIFRVSKAVKAKEYSLLSRDIKILMLTGVLSMVLLRIM